jgi:hypothetical protein
MQEVLKHQKHSKNEVINDEIPVIPTHLNIHSNSLPTKKKSMFFKKNIRKNIFIVENNESNKEISFNEILDLKENSQNESNFITSGTDGLFSIHSAPSMNNKGNISK